MAGGLFIALYDEESLKLYLDKGVYGFIMPPVNEEKPSARSRHYNILADYACSRDGAEVFFFLKRKVVYGGRIYGNSDSGSFFLNGPTSPLGRKACSELFWDESSRYTKTTSPGIFRIKRTGPERAQPFIFQFHKNENTGRFIPSDDLYFELGQYPYPLPSNSMQNMGFCTLTPGEVSTLNNLLKGTENRITFEGEGQISKHGKETIFDKRLVSIEDEVVNEAQLEFTILASLEPFSGFLKDNYVLCRQVPISPFKPSEMDRADICLYSMTQPIKSGTIPNVIIELKKDIATKSAYEQVVRYLRWLKNITSEEDYAKIKAYIIAPRISKIKKSSVTDGYKDKIELYSIETNSFVNLMD